MRNIKYNFSNRRCIFRQTVNVTNAAYAGARERIEKARKHFGASSPRIVPILFDVAKSHLEEYPLVNVPMAEQYLNEALSILESNYGSSHLDVTEALMHLAWLKIKIKNGPEAYNYAARALKIRQQLMPPDDWKIAESKNFVAWGLALMGRQNEAAQVFRDLFPVFQREFVKLMQQPVPPNPTLELVQSHFYLLGNGDRLQRLNETQNAIRGRTPGGGGGNKSCFVATVAYGDPDCDELNTLRDFRDNKLNKTAPGRLFIRTYYKHGEHLANMINKSKTAKSITKRTLDCLIKFF